MQDYNKSENYINRELSWLDFNLRVLHEARDKENPLFERLKFLAITSSNLDEFFMVRVASLKNMEISDYKKKDASGLTPHEQLEKISEKTHNMVDMQYSTYEKLLLPQLAVENISILNRNQLSEEQKEFIEKYFKNEIYPVLTPMAVDSSRPFPLIQNKVLNICALIKKENKEQAFATVQIPSVFKRIVKLPSENGKKQFILLEEIVQEFLPMLFMGYDVLCSYSYRVMRDADIPIDEDDSEDLLIEIEKSLKERERSGVIRLEVDSKVKGELLSILKKELKVKNDDIYKINEELKNYNEELASRPQIIAANKTDVIYSEDEDPVEKIRAEFEPQGIKVFPISAVSGKGVKELLSYIWEVLKELPQEPVVFEQEYFPGDYNSNDNLSYTVEQLDEHTFVVEGPKIEKMLGYTNLDSEKGFLFFQNFLKNTGILKDLEAAGIQDGDTVRMYGLQFDYYKE